MKRNLFAEDRYLVVVQLDRHGCLPLRGFGIGAYLWKQMYKCATEGVGQTIDTAHHASRTPRCSQPAAACPPLLVEEDCKAPSSELGALSFACRSQAGRCRSGMCLQRTEFRFLQLRVLRAVACACTAPTTGGPRQVHESRGMAPTSRGKCTLPLEVKLVPASDRSELFGSFSLV